MSKGVDQEKSMAAPSNNGRTFPSTATEFVSFLFTSEGQRLTKQAINNSTLCKLSRDLTKKQKDTRINDSDDEFDNTFNIKAIKEHVVNCANDHKRTPADLTMDIISMVGVGLQRGNIRRDQLARTNPRGVEKVKKLAYWYKIPMRSSARERIPVQSDTLTFVRALSCYPDIASVYLFKKVGLARNGERSVLASEQLPDPMKHAGFSGLIPKGCDPYLMKVYLFAHAAYMVDFNNMINQGGPRTLKAKAARQLNVCKLGVEESPCSDGLRVRILRFVGLTDPDVFKIIVNVCNNMCKIVGEPELSFETAENNHIKNNVICFFEDEDDSKDLAADELDYDFAADEQEMDLDEKLKATSINDLDHEVKVSTSTN